MIVRKVEGFGVEVDGVAAMRAFAFDQIVVLVVAAVFFVVILVVVKENFFHFSQIVVDGADILVQIVVLILKVLKLRGYVAQNVDHRLEEAAGLALSVDFHAFGKALQIRNAIRNLAHISPFHWVGAAETYRRSMYSPVRVSMRT